MLTHINTCIHSAVPYTASSKGFAKAKRATEESEKQQLTQISPKNDRERLGDEAVPYSLKKFDVLATIRLSVRTLMEASEQISANVTDPICA